MRATGGVDVMVPGIPTQMGRIDPAFQLKRDLRGRLSDFQPLLLLPVLGSACVFDGILAGWKQDALAVSAIDLGMESKVGRKALSLGRVDALLGVPNKEGASG